MKRATIEEWVYGWIESPSREISTLRTYARRCDEKYAEVIAERNTLRQVRDILRTDRDDMKAQRDLLIDAVRDAPCRCAPRVVCKRCVALERAWVSAASPSAASLQRSELLRSSA